MAELTPLRPPATPRELELAQQLRETQIDFHRTIAILLAKLGGSAHITAAELDEWVGTFTRTPDPHGSGFTLTVEQEGGT